MTIFISVFSSHKPLFWKCCVARHTVMWSHFPGRTFIIFQPLRYYKRFRTGRQNVYWHLGTNLWSILIFSLISGNWNRHGLSLVLTIILCIWNSLDFSVKTLVFVSFRSHGPNLIVRHYFFSPPKYWFLPTVLLQGVTTDFSSKCVAYRWDILMPLWCIRY